MCVCVCFCVCVCVCLFFALNRSFDPSTSSTTSVPCRFFNPTKDTTDQFCGGGSLHAGVFFICTNFNSLFSRSAAVEVFALVGLFLCRVFP